MAEMHTREIEKMEDGHSRLERGQTHEIERVQDRIPEYEGNETEHVLTDSDQWESEAMTASGKPLATTLPIEHQRQVSDQLFEKNAIICELLTQMGAQADCLRKQQADCLRKQQWQQWYFEQGVWPNGLLGQLQNYHSYDMYGNSDQEAIHDKFLRLFKDSCVKHRASLRSQRWCDPPKLEVLKITILAPNYRLIRQYDSRAKEIAELRPEGVTGIPLLNRSLVPPSRSSTPDRRDLNEHWLFHGTKDDNVKNICSQGFDPRISGCGAGTLFGKATYFATNASKADGYTGINKSYSDKRTIIVARVLLGESFRATRQMGDLTRPPVGGSHGEPLDSVWADVRENGGTVDHPEVMVYDKGQAYPEALITYRHMKDCWCSNCARRY